MGKKAISLTDLESYLNTYLNAKAFDEKAYNGVQVATSIPITKIATAVSTSIEVIEAAIQQEAQALVVHHGIFRKGDAHPLTGRLYEMVRLLMQHNIALLGYHLPLDAHQEVGNNWRVALDLGLQNCTPFLEYGGNHIGVVGELNALPFDQFREKVETYYDRPADAVQIHETVKKVAIVSGGADGFLNEAAAVGADCYITGRVDEKVWDDAHEYRVSFLGLGHYGTEVVGPRALAAVLQKQFAIPAVFIKTENPF